MYRYRRLIRYVLRQWPALAAIAALTLVSSGAVALQPWPMKLLVDYALGDAEVPSALASMLNWLRVEPTPTVLVITAAVASLAVFAINNVLTVGLGLAWSLGGQRMVYDLAGDLFARLQRLSMLFHSRRNVGDSLSRLTEDTWCIYSVTSGLLIAPMQQVITLLVLVSIGFALDPMLTWLVVAVAPLLAASSRFFGQRLKRRAKLGREAKSRLMSFVHQTLGAIPIVQAFGTEDRNTQQFDGLAEDAVVLSQRGNLVGSGYGLVNGLINTGGLAVVLFVGGSRVLSGAIPLGTLLVFLAYARQMQGASGGLFQIFAQLKAAEASIDRVLEVMDCDELVHDAADAKPLPLPVRGKSGHVAFEQVTFGYEPDRPVLVDVTLEARPDQAVALVGPTGAGKSTLVSLILRFFDPWEGRVTFDDTDIRTVKLADLRSQVSIVLQEPFLLPLSVAENIAYGRPGAHRDQIIAAAVSANAHPFIERLPQGYDTVLGEQGATLSGGERQRLSIARALLKDAPVLILDEPTSALDAQTEASLLEAIERLTEGRTTFIIAHRLSTIRHADQIVVLEHGRVVQLGAHQDLLAQDGLYRQLYRCQFADTPSKVVA